MDILKDLKQKRLIAIKTNNNKDLSILNNQIYLIKDRIRKEKEKQRQIDRDNKFNNKVLTIMEDCLCIQ